MSIELGQGALAKVDIVLSQGSTNRYTFRYLAGELIPTPLDLSSWTGRAQIRRSVASADTWLETVAALTADGLVSIVIPYEATQGTEWDARDEGVWALELTSPSDERIRLVEGRVRVSHGASRDA